MGKNLENVSAKNGNSAQNNVQILKSNARTLLKHGVGLDHMYTKGGIFSPGGACTARGSRSGVCE